jgi:hypothetical protein
MMMQTQEVAQIYSHYVVLLPMCTVQATATHTVSGVSGKRERLAIYDYATLYTPRTCIAVRFTSNYVLCMQIRSEAAYGDEIGIRNCWHIAKQR